MMINILYVANNMVLCKNILQKIKEKNKKNNKLTHLPIYNIGNK